MNNFELIKGIFIEESKNRFLCKVLVEGVLHECYVPSSSKIENYLNINNKEILLTRNHGENKRTKYSLFAVKYHNKYIILNLNIINRIVANIIQSNKLKPLRNYIEVGREKVIGDYKVDLLLSNKSNEKLVVEIKGVISPKREANFPSVHSERALDQLTKIKKMLQDNQKVCYIIVSLSPSVKNIILDYSYNEYCERLKECIKLGLEVYALSVKLEEGCVIYNKTIKMIF